jgi:outer membrane receptor for ferrienterochelin and colicin
MKGTIRVTIRVTIIRNQTQSDAIRRNQTQSDAIKARSMITCGGNQSQSGRLRWHSEANHTFELEVPPLTLTRRGRNDESGELCSLAYT